MADEAYINAWNDVARCDHCGLTIVSTCVRIGDIIESTARCPACDHITIYRAPSPVGLMHAEAASDVKEGQAVYIDHDGKIRPVPAGAGKVTIDFHWNPPKEPCPCGCGVEVPSGPAPTCGVCWRFFARESCVLSHGCADKP